MAKIFFKSPEEVKLKKPKSAYVDIYKKYYKGKLLYRALFFISLIINIILIIYAIRF